MKAWKREERERGHCLVGVEGWGCQVPTCRDRWNPLHPGGPHITNHWELPRPLCVLGVFRSEGRRLQENFSDRTPTNFDWSWAKPPKSTVKFVFKRSVGQSLRNRNPPSRRFRPSSVNFSNWTPIDFDRNQVKPPEPEFMFTPTYNPHRHLRCCYLLQHRFWLNCASDTRRLQ